MPAKPKKSLGQNFLHDKNIIDKIIKVSKISNNDEVLEIGPGTGNLTKLIINQNPKKIFVIEKDVKLAEDLKKKFFDRINVITNDILKIPYEFFTEKNFIILGNLPYNISTKILSNFCLNNKLKVKKMILMFQKKLQTELSLK